MSPNKWLGAPYGAALRKDTVTRIAQVHDFSKGRAFAHVGVAAICTSFRKESDRPISVFVYTPNSGTKNVHIERSCLEENDNWGFLLSSNIDILMAISENSLHFGDFVTATDPFTVSEAYDLKPIIKEVTETSRNYFRFVNTGTIDPFITLWESGDVRYLKTTFRRPIVDKAELEAVFPRRFEQASHPKLILSGMRKFEAFLDDKGAYVAGKSSVIVMPTKSNVSLLTLLGILNSTFMKFFVQEFFGVLGVDGGISFSGKLIEALPLPECFSGKIDSIDKVVLDILSLLKENKNAEIDFEVLDDLVFSVYGISPEYRSRIATTELRC